MKRVLGTLWIAVLSAGAATNPAGELSRQAVQLYQQVRYREAEALFRQAIDAWKQQGWEGAQGGAIDQRRLGSLLEMTGRYQEAEALLKDSLDALEASGAPATETVCALSYLSAARRAQGDFAGAESWALRATAAAERSEDVSGAERLSVRLLLGSVYVEQRRFPEAEGLLRSVLDGGDAPTVLAAYTNLSNIAIARGEFDQAETFLRQALHLARLALPPNHPSLAVAWNNLAQVARFQRHYVEAEKDYRQAIEIWELVVGPWHPDLAKGLTNLGSLYHERGREAGAEELYGRAAAIFEKAFGKDDPRTLVARNELADILRAERRYTEAEKLEKATLAPLERTLAEDDPRVARARMNYARLLNETKRPKDADRMTAGFREAQ